MRARVPAFSNLPMKRSAIPRICLAFAALGLVQAASVGAWSQTRSLKEIRETDLLRQEWDTSCGAAALATVLTFTFNDPVSERDVVSGLLRQTEPVIVRHRGGFSLLDMKRYVAERGYRAVGFSGMSIADIRYMDAPIVPVSFHGYSHYVVFRGVTGDGAVAIADPAFGNRTISRERFEDAWIEGMAFVILRESA